MLIYLLLILLIISFILWGITYFKLRQKSRLLNEKQNELDFYLKGHNEISIQKSQLSKNLMDSNEKLKKANLKLQELNLLKEDFVSVASHELRTPMAAIRSYAWMALNKSDVSLSDKLKKYLVRILISTERLINLVNDLLNVSRIEAGKIEINPEPVNLIPLTKDVMDEVYYSKSLEKQVHLVVAENPTPKVFADPEKLREVMLNLIGNAVKFTPPGGTITVDFFSDGNNVETTIKDTGLGFMKEDLSRIFQKFGKLDNSYVSISTSGGTGLGLYISKNLIDLMHGKIWASSEGLGKGSTFTFSLPVASGETKPLEPVAI